MSKLSRWIDWLDLAAGQWLDRTILKKSNARAAALRRCKYKVWLRASGGRYQSGDAALHAEMAELWAEILAERAAEEGSRR